MSATSQKYQILAYLKSGRSLTPLRALELFKCFRLAARVCELKREGHNIQTFRWQVGKVWVARYSLGKVRNERRY